MKKADFFFIISANRIGDCGDGTSDFGCGVQETYVNCADIAIKS